MFAHGIITVLVRENLEVNKLDKWRLALEGKKLRISRSKIEYEFGRKRPRGLTRLGEQ